jgi:outer membrane protein
MKTRMLWIKRVAMTMVGALAMTTVALRADANPALYEEAKRLIAAMNAKQAYMLLIAKQDTLTGVVEFDYLLGVAALDSGKVDESIIAFERVLAVQPNNAGAQLDLARAYFTVGSLDLAEGTFRKLKALNPPPAALQAIDRYLQAISERRRAARRMASVWGELAFGYDTNLTAVPNDFTTAIQQAFNLAGVSPTGNSIKRKAGFLGAGVGADLIVPISERWNGYVGGDLRGRGYQRENEFNSGTAETRAGAFWDRGPHQVRFTASYNAFFQQGDAPGEPKPTNDRRAAVVGSEYRYSLSNTRQVGVGVAAAQTRFPKNNVEDFNSTIASLSLTNVFPGKYSPTWQLTLFGSNDKAVRTLADGVTDKSKKIAGIRSYQQVSFNDKLSLFSSLGYAQRRDDRAFARATAIEFGRDKLADGSLGVNWRFQPACNMRAQWAGSRNDSNIAIYDYTRHEVSSTIRCEFM